MFNLFNKKNDGNKEDCYLLKSGVFEKKIQDDDNLEQYNDILHDDEASNNFKDLIRYFLIPYKISILKYTLNKEYYEDPFPIDNHNNHKHIAPSLKKLKENPLEIAMGYPSWFLIAFPDVSLWVMKGDGFEIIKNRFEKCTEEELSDGNHIRLNLLNDIIKLYLLKTNKSLECKKY